MKQLPVNPKQIEVLCSHSTGYGAGMMQTWDVWEVTRWMPDGPRIRIGKRNVKPMTWRHLGSVDTPADTEGAFQAIPSELDMRPGESLGEWIARKRMTPRGPERAG